MHTSTHSAAEEERSFLNHTRSFNGSTQGLWHRSAPKSVRRAFADGKLLDGWTRWLQHLDARDEPRPLAKLLSTSSDPLTWSLPEPSDGPLGPEWLKPAAKLAKKGRRADAELEKQLLGWLADTSGRSADERLALEALACCHALPWLAAVVAPEIWWAALDQLLVAVADAGALDVEAAPVVHQLIAGELALTLAYLLPEITACRRLKGPARRALSSGLEELLDGEGMPHGRWLDESRPLLACWTRCCLLGRQWKRGGFSAAAEVQYDWLLRQTMRLSRHDGSLMLGDGRFGSQPALLEAALRLSGDKEDRKIARLAMPGKKNRSGRQSVARVRLPEASCHSEWAGAAVLRPDWSRGCQRLALLYHEPVVRLELVSGRDVVLSGTWDIDVRLEGQPVALGSSWRSTCWESDEDVDYLELEMELGDGVQIQRQVALAREDRFLFLADAVVSRRPGLLEYRSDLPLGAGIEFEPADESREGMLRGTRRRGRVMPLALPEWRALESPGELTAQDGRLRLAQQAETSLYAPLFFDLERGRLSKRFTWRRLTVAEQLEIVSPEKAAGYRVAVGREQWLIYRALAGRGNRTLLGHNLATETLIAQFDETGKPARIVEIE